jgi:hypothetical protein
MKRIRNREYLGVRFIDDYESYGYDIIDSRA